MPYAIGKIIIFDREVYKSSTVYLSHRGTPSSHPFKSDVPDFEGIPHPFLGPLGFHRSFCPSSRSEERFLEAVRLFLGLEHQPEERRSAGYTSGWFHPDGHVTGASCFGHGGWNPEMAIQPGKWGVPQKRWMVLGKILKWMMTRGTPMTQETTMCLFFWGPSPVIDSVLWHWS